MLEYSTRGAHQPSPLRRGVSCGDPLTEHGFHEFRKDLTIPCDAQRAVLPCGTSNRLVCDRRGRVHVVGADEEPEEAVVVVGKDVGRRTLVANPVEVYDVALSCERESGVAGSSRWVPDAGDEWGEGPSMMGPWDADRRSGADEPGHPPSVAERCAQVARQVLSPNGECATRVQRAPIGGASAGFPPAIRPHHGAARAGRRKWSPVLPGPRDRTLGDDGGLSRVEGVLLCERLSPLSLRAGLVN